ncbi:MAG: ABC transporter permease/substrate-binding protein [Blautia sp.]|nr:ABC transporter permease/substrate-binding protein [Blautia sp.]
MSRFLEVLLQRREELFQLFTQHMQMTSVAVLISICLGVPIGIAITKNKKTANVIIAIANLVQSIPSIGLLAFLVPIVGIGQKPAIIMVIIYALLPIIKNTYIGLTGIAPSTLESAKAIGLSKFETLFKIQLPIAMPYIMAGIRISAVTAVGTVTIAAFAGAGGLGWFINLGLNANDANLVLLGAIPACILALVVDFILGKIETVLTPEGLKEADKVIYYTESERKSRMRTALLLFFIVLVLPCFGSALSVVQKKQDKIVVGCENFTEALILGNIYSQLIQGNTEIPVEEKFNLDGTMITMSSIEKGEIDMFTDYTGVLAPNVLGMELSTDTEKVYEEVKVGMKEQYNLEVSNPIGFSNTYVFAVPKNVSDEYNITTISQLINNASSLRLGCTVAFTQRNDLLPKLENEYGVSFKSVNGLEGNIRYQAIASGKIDVTDAYETDAMLKKMDLISLQDNINYFPPYQAVSVTREEVLNQYPELREILEKLDNAITTQEMMDMNYQVDVEGKTPKETAIQFLKNKKIIQ